MRLASPTTNNIIIIPSKINRFLFYSLEAASSFRDFLMVSALPQAT
jgi:hypothetical protein